MGRLERRNSLQIIGKAVVTQTGRRADLRANLLGEPAMADVLADKGIRQMMDCDGVAVDQLNALLAVVRARLS